MTRDRRVGHVARTVAAVGALLAAGWAAPAAAADDGGAGDRRDELVAEVERELATERDTLRVTGATAAERADAVATLPAPDATTTLDRQDASFPLDVADATTGLETERQEEGETVVVLTSDLLFPFDESALTPAASEALAELVSQIPEGAAVAVDGHTDSMGTDARNDELSVARADAVAAVLRSARPDLALTIEGHGSREPVAENSVGGEDDPAGRALNRRVELSYADG